ncbi:response regulator transcription factor [bacterium]|nr:response regulator transcription factor [bacterium]MCI0603287.1 response regulator transcription factor [bacterium]
MSTQKIRVLVVDDHPVVREGLAAMISREPDMTVVAQARDARQAMELFRTHLPDVTLLDLSLPDQSGVEVIAALRPEFPDARFIVLSVFDGNEDIYRALKAGALSYLLKDSEPDELLHAIREINAGKKYLPGRVASKLAERITEDYLTSREQEVVQLMADGKSNKQIADDLNVSEGTVKNHVTNVLEKLGVTSRSHAIVEALRRGIVHPANLYRKS